MKRQLLAFLLFNLAFWSPLNASDGLISRRDFPHLETVDHYPVVEIVPQSADIGFKLVSPPGPRMRGEDEVTFLKAEAIIDPRLVLIIAHDASVSAAKLLSIALQIHKATGIRFFRYIGSNEKEDVFFELLD